MTRAALVTGANQGLGFAITAGLAARLEPGDVVYLTARREREGRLSTERLAGGAGAEVAFWPLDVTDRYSISALVDMIKERHGGIDIVVSNAAARMSRDIPLADQVTHFINTNNHGARNLYGALLPVLRAGASYAMVASSFGRLTNLTPSLHPLFDTDRLDLDDIEKAMDYYSEQVVAGTAVENGWPEWINIPSKIAQVASARIAARQIAETRPGSGIVINAVCPGLVDTGASRPWFDDMSNAQSPDEAAKAILTLLLEPEAVGFPNGQLMQFGKSLPWLE